MGVDPGTLKLFEQSLNAEENPLTSTQYKIISQKIDDLHSEQQAILMIGKQLGSGWLAREANSQIVSAPTKYDRYSPKYASLVAQDLER